SGANVGALHVLPGFSASFGGGGTAFNFNASQNTIGVDTGSSLVLNGQFVANANPMNKVGAGTLELQGAFNTTFTTTNTGTITINDGTIRLNKRPGVGGNVGPVFVVGDNAGAGVDTLELASPGQLSATAGVTVQSTGLL